MTKPTEIPKLDPDYGHLKFVVKTLKSCHDSIVDLTKSGDRYRGNYKKNQRFSSDSCYLEFGSGIEDYKNVVKRAKESVDEVLRCKDELMISPGEEEYFDLITHDNVAKELRDDIKNFLDSLEWRVGSLSRKQEEEISKFLSHFKVFGADNLRSRYGAFAGQLLWGKLNDAISKHGDACTDNCRVCRLDDPIDVEAYKMIKSNGCCGSYDEEVDVLFKKYRVGFNYGH